MAQVLEGTLKMYVGRLAPSPTGALHLGNIRTLMIAYLRARTAGGRLIFRMEDLDHPKDKPGAAAEIVRDLRWLGFEWDEEYVQSARREIYREALRSIREWVYPCVCTRKDVENAQSAPHAGEQLYYPGTCRNRFASWDEAAKVHSPCWRFKVEKGTRVAFDDVFAGHVEQDVAATLGDFPLARDRDGAGYTFACTLDDLLMGVTEVVRGDDLLPATPAQILLRSALQKNLNLLPQPQPQPSTSTFSSPLAFCHVPLVVGPDGRRLAKRHGDTRIATYRARGVSPKRILGFLAASCGWAEADEEVTLADLLPRFTLSTLPYEPFVCFEERVLHLV